MIRPPLARLYDDEIIVDNFAGGGGASTGIEMALGRSPDIAVNHDPEAIALHEANHPTTKHYCESVWDIDPIKVCGGRRVGLAWFSPDCKHFSKAKGGKPVNKHIRGLAWIVVKWAKLVKPRVIMLENVEEFEQWGPLTEDFKPCPLRKGFTFRRWKKQLENLGYVVEMRQMRACDYGAPTIRKRLFIVARCDGQPIVWPEATHGKGLLPYRSAAECIDWSIPCPSIFERAKPLAENTLNRIAKGIFRYVINAAKPFIVPTAHSGDARAHDIDEPLRTITGSRRGDHALVTPYLAGVGGRAGQSRPRGADEPMATMTAKADTALITPILVGAGGPTYSAKPKPLDVPFNSLTTENHTALIAPYITRIGQTGANGKQVSDVEDPLTTITSKNEHLLIAPFLKARYGEREGQEPRTRSIEEPMATVVPTGNGGDLVSAVLVKQNFGDKPCLGADEPMHTVTTQGNKHALVSAFMTKHYGEGANGQFAGGKGSAVSDPLPTITGRGTQLQLTAAALSNQYTSNTGGGQGDLFRPMPTITAGGNHQALVRAFLMKYHTQGGQWAKLQDPAPTIPTHDSLGLVTVEGEQYAITDIGMRMLMPRELYNAQGFRPDYKIEILFKGKPLTKTAQVRMCGNSVSPYNACALVVAQFSEQRMQVVA